MGYIFLWILALFGLWTLISNLLDSVYMSNKEGIFDVELNVYNQEDTIQLIISRLTKIELIGAIKIHDNKSTDSTVNIVKEIQKSNKKVVFMENT